MKKRFLALDVFRGATVALMILVNNPGNWGQIFSPLEHATWHGCTPTDLVFPFFLFASGNSVAFGMPSLKSGGFSVMVRKVRIRALLIFLIGIFLNWAPFVRWDGDHLAFKSWENVRIFGVLQRIALAYLFASLLIYFTNLRTLLFSTAVLLIGYWLMCIVLGNPLSPFSLEGFWGTAIDRSLLGKGHIYKGEGVPFDPEGIISTIGAIPQVIIGYLTGRYLILHGSEYKTVTNLFSAGVLLTFAGFCFDLVFPVNKKIWTSSFVLYTSGIAILILALIILFTELKRKQGSLTRFFEVFGKNPLFIFVLSGLLPRLLALLRIPTENKGYESPFAWFYTHVCQPIFTYEKNSSLFYALCMVALYWAIGFIMDRRKIYVKV